MDEGGKAVAGQLGHTTSGNRSGPTVLLLHGVGTTSWMWRRLVADLADQLHVVTVDLPGHGASARTPWTSLGASMSQTAELAQLVGQGGSVHVVGLSLGGYVATDLAAAHPELVASATVSGVNVLPFRRPRLMRALGRVMSPMMTSGVMLRLNARALDVPAEDYQGYAAAARSTAPGTFLAVGGDLMDYSVPAGASSSSSRVLAVAGGDEQPLILQSLPHIAAAFPRGSARVAPGVAHAWNGQAPELFAATVRAHVHDDPLPRGLSAVAA